MTAKYFLSFHLYLAKIYFQSGLGCFFWEYLSHCVLPAWMLMGGLLHDFTQILHMPKVLCWDNHPCWCWCKIDSLSTLDIRLRYHLVHQNLGGCVPHGVTAKGWTHLKDALCKLSRGMVWINPIVTACRLNALDKQDGSSVLCLVAAKSASIFYACEWKGKHSQPSWQGHYMGCLALCMWLVKWENRPLNVVPSRYWMIRCDTAEQSRAVWHLKHIFHQMITCSSPAASRVLSGTEWYLST